ncbi:MAG: thioredoxin [Saprospiraceae bacterium]
MKGNFTKLIKSTKPILIDFFATWCGPCKAQMPILKEVAKEAKGKVRIIKIDIDKNQSLATKYKVKSVPTLMIFKNGKAVWTQSGMQTKKKLLDAITAHS